MKRTRVVLLAAILAGVLLAGGLLFSEFQGTARAADGSVTITVTDMVGLPIGAESTDVDFLYVINYSCAHFTEDCEGMVVTDPLPNEIVFMEAIGNGAHPSTNSYNSGLHEVTFAFNDTVPAGASGQLSIRARCGPQGNIANGTVALNQVKVDTSNPIGGTQWSNTVSITAIAANDWYLQDKTIDGDGQPALDQGVKYRLRFCSDSDNGTLDLEPADLFDYFETGAVVLDADGGSVVGTTITWNWANVVVDRCETRNPVIMYPSGVFAPTDTVCNDVELKGMPVGEAYQVIGTSQICHTFYAEDPSADGDKWSSTNLAEPGDRVYWKFDLDSDGNSSLENVVMRDTIPTEFLVDRVRYGKWTPNIDAGVEYSQDGGFGWTYLGTHDGQGSKYDFLPTSPAVTHVRWTFQDDLPSYFDMTQSTYLRGDIIRPGWDGFLYSLPHVSTNCVVYEFSNLPDQQHCDDITIDDIADESWGDPKKVDTLGLQYPPSANILFDLRVENDGSAALPIDDPILMDLLPPEVLYDGWTELTGDLGTPVVEVINDYNATGRTLVRFSWPGETLQPGDDDWVQIEGQIGPGVPNATYYNQAHMTSNTTAIDRCDQYDIDSNDLDGDGNTTEQLCVDTEGFDVQEVSAAAISAEKWILGNPVYPPTPGGCDIDPEGYTRYPCIAITDPLGNADYKIIVTNVGTIPLDEIVVIDVLPYFGDVGVTELLYSVQRGSEWEPELTGWASYDPPPAGATVTTTYSEVNNPCRDEMSHTGASPWPPFCVDDWQGQGGLPGPEAVKSIKWEVDFGGLSFMPGDTLTFRVPMKAGAGSPTGGEVAWNSFGYRAMRDDNMQLLDPSEPVKVGIQLKEPDNGMGDIVWRDVELWNNDTSTLHGTVTTINGGQWFFPNVLPGFNYYAKFELENGFEFSPKDMAPDDIDSDAFDSGPDIGKTEPYWIGPTDDPRRCRSGRVPATGGQRLPELSVGRWLRRHPPTPCPARPSGLPDLGRIRRL